MPDGPEICSVCAWRADCKKKYSISGRDMRCADFSKDITLDNSPPPPDKEDISKREEK
jgi:hypothetical protein